MICSVGRFTLTRWRHAVQRGREIDLDVRRSRESGRRLGHEDGRGARTDHSAIHPLAGRWACALIGGACRRRLNAFRIQSMAAT